MGNPNIWDNNHLLSVAKINVIDLLFIFSEIVVSYANLRKFKKIGTTVNCPFVRVISQFLLVPLNKK